MPQLQTWPQVQDWIATNYNGFPDILELTLSTDTTKPIAVWVTRKK